MSLPSLKSESDSTLFTNIKSLRGTEAATTAEIILHLFEIDSRGIYRNAGYTSLFSYCVEALGYSGASAARRIEAARSLKDNPEIYELIKQGKLTLCALSTVAKVLNPENKETVLKLSQGKTKLQVQQIAAQFGPVDVKPARKDRRS